MGHRNRQRQNGTTAVRMRGILQSGHSSLHAHDRPARGVQRKRDPPADALQQHHPQNTQRTAHVQNINSTRSHSVKKRQAVVSVATSSCASARKDGENEPNQINGCVPMKEKCQWSAVIDNIIPASGRPQKHTGEHVSRRKRTAEAVS